MTATNTLPRGANGSLDLNLGWRGGFQSVRIIGGPYDKYRPSDNTFGVCVRTEMIGRLAIDAWVPIHDFEVPEDDAQVEQALMLAFDAAIRGRLEVYVGCMGGWGRTGLFLALMAKAAGVEQPVKYVREHYTPRAVETRDQMGYVANFDVSRVQKAIRRMGWRRFFRLG